MRVSKALARHEATKATSTNQPIARQAPPTPRQEATKKNVLFVCIGNACRSQMAEAFARRYGSDVIAVSSAGLSPATTIPDLTKAVMLDKNITLDEQFPKGIEIVPNQRWDVVVNISGHTLPALDAEHIVEWKIQDPMGQRQAVHEKVRDEIENLVMRLILELRTQAKRG
jgi:arsenate reductase